MKKRLIRIALVLLAVLLVFPTVAFAETEYVDWESTTTLPTTTGAYKLTDDVTIAIQTIIRKGNDVTLDLNGHKVTFTGTHSATGYQVQYGAKLTIEDSSADGSGLMINTGNSYMIHTYGDCIINGGTIESTTTSGRAIFVQGSSGKIATCTLNDGIIRNSLHNGGRAVVVHANATFTMNDGKVENKAEGTYGTVKAIEGGNVIINGGTVESAGTAIYSNVETIIRGGTIKAGWFAFETRDVIIEPAEGKTVNVVAGKNAISTTTAGDKAAMFNINSKLAASVHGNKVLGGNFDAPRLLALSSLDDKNLELAGGLYTIDVSDYVAAGYVVTPAAGYDVDMYEVKLNRPYVTNDTLKEDDELLGEIEMGVVSEQLQGELEEVFEKEIDENEKIQEALLDGKSVNIHVQVERLEQKDINEAELKTIKETVKDDKLVKFYDITLVVSADGQQIDTITKTTNKLKFKILVPEDLIKVGRTFFMYRYHDGENGPEVEKLTGKLDEDNYFTFETDKFSTYALAYEDIKVKDNTPATGSMNVVMLVSAAIAVTTFGVLVSKKYAKNN